MSSGRNMGASAEPTGLSQAEPVSRLGPPGFDPSRAAIPNLVRPPYCNPNEFLLLSSYCGEDNPSCSEGSPCADCLSMCNVFGEDGKYLRMLGGAPFDRSGFENRVRTLLKRDLKDNGRITKDGIAMIGAEAEFFVRRMRPAGPRDIAQ